MVVWHQGANADGTNAQRTSTNAWDMSCVESHPYIDVSIHAYMRTSTRAYTHICITACVNLDMCAPLCLDTRTCNLHRTDSAKALIQRAFDIVRVPYDVDLRDAIQARQTGHIPSSTHTHPAPSPPPPLSLALVYSNIKWEFDSNGNKCTRRK